MPKNGTVSARPKRRDDSCCTAEFLKYVLHIYNILFLTAGILVLGAAIWTLLDKYEYVSLLTTETYQVLIYFLLAAGGLVLIVTFVGFCSVAKENRCFLLVYIFLVLLIFLIEAMVGIVAFVYQEQVHDELEINLNNTFVNNYGYDNDTTTAIDFLQENFHCCGVGYYNDWEASKWRLNGLSGMKLVPDSCCKTLTSNCGRRTHPSNINYNGCLEPMERHIKEHLGILSVVGLGICVLQIFGIIYACCLYCKLKDIYDYRIEPTSPRNLYE